MKKLTETRAIDNKLFCKSCGSAIRINICFENRHLRLAQNVTFNHWGFFNPKILAFNEHY